MVIGHLLEIVHEFEQLETESQATECQEDAHSRLPLVGAPPAATDPRSRSRMPPVRSIYQGRPSTKPAPVVTSHNQPASVRSSTSTASIMPDQPCVTTQCCDDSPNRHASKHARASGHPVIASAEPGERWLYCYPDDAFAEYREREGGPLKISTLVTGGSQGRN